MSSPSMKERKKADKVFESKYNKLTAEQKEAFSRSNLTIKYNLGIRHIEGTVLDPKGRSHFIILTDNSKGFLDGKIITQEVAARLFQKFNPIAVLQSEREGHGAAQSSEEAESIAATL